MTQLAEWHHVTLQTRPLMLKWWTTTIHILHGELSLIIIITVQWQNVTDHTSTLFYTNYIFTTLTINICITFHIIHCHCHQRNHMLKCFVCWLLKQTFSHHEKLLWTNLIHGEKCAKFHGKFTEGVWKIHGPHSRYFEVLCSCKLRNLSNSTFEIFEQRILLLLLM